MIMELDVKQAQLEGDLKAHERECAMRYAEIEKSFESGSRRMTRIEYLLYATILAVLFGPGVAATFVKKFLGL